MTREAQITLRRLALAVCAAAALAPAGADEPPRVEFSADLVTRNAAGVPSQTPGRLYVAGRRVRIETGAAAGGFYLIDTEARTAWFVRPAQQLFTDAGGSSPLTQIFVPVDPQAPCADWQAATGRSGVAGSDWRCERLTASGSGGVPYQVGFAGSSASERWVDPALRFPVRVRAGDGTSVTLEHIEAAPQPAALFALPATFRRLDPRALIERIKHSDVWAGRSD